MDAIEEKCVDDWLLFLQSRGRKVSTCGAYRSVMERIFETLKELDIPTEPEAVDEEVIFLVMDRLSNLKEGTLRYYMTIWGYFVEWATGHDPVKAAKILWNNTEPDRVFITMDDFVRMYEVGDPTDRLILCLGAFMGLRRMEMANLRYEDMKGGRMTIYGKGHGLRGKVEVMKIPKPVQDALKEYENYKHKAFKGKTDVSGGNVLLHRSTGDTVTSYKPNDFSNRIRALGEKVGIRAQTHSLRRLFATTLHDSGLDLMDIKTLMRHTKIETTVRCYIRPNQIKLDAVMDSLNFGTV